MQKFIFIILGCAALIVSSCRDTVDEWPPTTHEITEVHVMNIDGSHEITLTNDQQIIKYANYTPDGQRIIYIQSSGGNGKQTLYSMFPDGTGKKPLVTSTLIAIGVSFTNQIDTSQRILFTPDSRKIIYSVWSGLQSSNFYARDIYCINIDGSNELNLTKNIAPNIGINNIALSSDGQRILYSEYDL